MKTLLIFESGVKLKALKKRLEDIKPEEIWLFPMTSEWKLISEVEKICKNKHSRDKKLIESTKIIEESVDLMREKIADWSAELGECKIEGKSIKDWFLLPEGGISTWWFSMLSEKNTLKDGSFLRMAQVCAIDRIIDKYNFDNCLISVGNRDSQNAIGMLCKRRSIRYYFVAHFPFATNDTMPIYIIKALWNLCRVISRSALSKIVMGNIKKRLKGTEKSLLFVSYFPSVDKEAAAKGVLRNR